jgi:hypothetical protein
LTVQLVCMRLQTCDPIRASNCAPIAAKSRLRPSLLQVYGSHNSSKADGSLLWIGNRFSFRNFQYYSPDLVKFFGLLGCRFMKRQKDGAAVGLLKLVFFGYGLAERVPDPKASQVFSPQEFFKNNLDQYINPSKRARREGVLGCTLLDPKGNRNASGLLSGLPSFIL